MKNAAKLYFLVFLFGLFSLVSAEVLPQLTLAGEHTNSLYVALGHHGCKSGWLHREMEVNGITVDGPTGLRHMMPNQVLEIDPVECAQTPPPEELAATTAVLQEDLQNGKRILAKQLVQPTANGSAAVVKQTAPAPLAQEKRPDSPVWEAAKSQQKGKASMGVSVPVKAASALPPTPPTKIPAASVKNDEAANKNKVALTEGAQKKLSNAERNDLIALNIQTGGGLAAFAPDIQKYAEGKGKAVPASSVQKQKGVDGVFSALSAAGPTVPSAQPPKGVPEQPATVMPQGKTNSAENAATQSLCAPSAKDGWWKISENYRVQLATQRLDINAANERLGIVTQALKDQKRNYFGWIIASCIITAAVLGAFFCWLWKREHPKHVQKANESLGRGKGAVFSDRYVDELRSSYEATISSLNARFSMTIAPHEAEILRMELAAEKKLVEILEKKLDQAHALGKDLGAQLTAVAAEMKGKLILRRTVAVNYRGETRVSPIAKIEPARKKGDTRLVVHYGCAVEGCKTRLMVFEDEDPQEPKFLEHYETCHASDPILIGSQRVAVCA